MNAKEANKLTHTALQSNEEIRRTINHVLGKIKNAAMKGKSYVNTPFDGLTPIPDGDIKRYCFIELESMGYVCSGHEEASLDDPEHDRWFSVSWSHHAISEKIP